MSLLLRSLALTCKRLLRRPGSALLLALPPALCLALSLFFARGEQSLAIRIGVVAGDDFGRAVFREIVREDSPLVFTLYGPEELPALTGQVAVGGLECVYVLAKPSAEDLAYGKAPGAITLIRSPGTVAHPLAGELVFGAFFRECAPHMAASLLEQVLEFSPQEAAAFVEERFLSYGESDIFLSPQYTYHGAQAAVPAQTTSGARLLHGLIALFLLAGALYAVPPMAREQTGLLCRLSPSGARQYLMGAAGGLAAQGLIQGILCLAAVAAVHPEALGGARDELLWLAAYALSLGLAATGFSLLLRRGDLVYSGGIFLLLLTALLGGALVDLGEIGPALGGVSRLFASSGYISGALGAADAAALAVTGLAGLALILLLAGKRNR